MHRIVCERSATACYFGRHPTEAAAVEFVRPFALPDELVLRGVAPFADAITLLAWLRVSWASRDYLESPAAAPIWQAAYFAMHGPCLPLTEGQIQ